jgi:hypothetical protein
MRADFGFQFGKDRRGGGTRRPRPSLFIRALEAAGLALVLVGLGAGRFGWAAVGVVLIVGSYALYRRKHGRGPPSETTDSADGPDLDGGGE